MPAVITSIPEAPDYLADLRNLPEVTDSGHLQPV